MQRPRILRKRQLGLRYTIPILFFFFIVLISVKLLEPTDSRRFLQTSGTATQEFELDTEGCDEKLNTVIAWYRIKDPALPVGVKVVWLMVYVFGVLYMFISLAVVCDEYFVPALEVMSDLLNLPADVAGATLMAAGGSAPELFTSVIGTFQESDVGFGTIVGSAVFNILFVIGMCAVYSEDVLVLTWWPVFRDMVWYIFALILLGMFFSVLSQQRIQMFESIILLCTYFCYVTFMAYNDTIHKAVYAMIGLPPPAVEEQATKFEIKTATFRAGILRLLIGEKSIWDTVPYRIITEIQGDLKKTFDEIDVNGDGLIDYQELSQLEAGMAVDWNVDQFLYMLDEDRSGSISFEEFQQWYIRSERRIEDEMKRVFDKFDTDGDGFLTTEELELLLRFSGVETASNMAKDDFSSRNGGGERPDDLLLDNVAKNRSDYYEDVQKTVDAIHKGDDNRGITFDEYRTWYKEQMFYDERKEDIEAEADHHASKVGDLLVWPDEQGFSGKFWYLVVLPLMLLLFLTIPDVRFAEKKKYAPLSFFLSIAWIGVFSVCMVDWASIIGHFAGIPSVVMGLTFLAAGTSVPDLLSSVIVAKRGYGDMAVSSSVGSNIFDVLIGLPFPWLLYSLVKGQDVLVASDNIGVSLFILLVMLVTVVVSFVASNWHLTPCLGYSMFGLYLVFVAQDLFRQKWDC